MGVRKAAFSPTYEKLLTCTWSYCRIDLTATSLEGCLGSVLCEVNPLSGNSFSPSQIDRQTGLVFIYSENSSQKELELDSLFLKISQIYMDYETEFLNIRLGRAPYHFGMGITYSASQNPFQHWISRYNQAVVYLEYSQFYLQPVLLHQTQKNKDSLLAGAEVGFLNEDWKVEALYQYDFKDSSSLELFGKYEQSNWDIKSSFRYAFEQNTNMALALEASIDIPSSFPLKFEIKSGGAFGKFSFHPNYDVALLFWNRFMTKTVNPPKTNPPQLNSPKKSESASFLQVAESQITKGVYVSPRLLFSFFNETLEIRPLGLLARSFKEKKFYYELDLEGMYQLDESLFFSIKGGVLYHKEINFALLAQAAVSF